MASGNASTSVRDLCSLSASASRETLRSLKGAVACPEVPTIPNSLRCFRFANVKEQSVARRITNPGLRLSSISTLTSALAAFRSKVHTQATLMLSKWICGKGFILNLTHEYDCELDPKLSCQPSAEMSEIIF